MDAQIWASPHSAGVIRYQIWLDLKGSGHAFWAVISIKERLLVVPDSAWRVVAWCQSETFKVVPRLPTNTWHYLTKSISTYINPWSSSCLPCTHHHRHHHNTYTYSTTDWQRVTVVLRLLHVSKANFISCIDHRTRGRLSALHFKPLFPLRRHWISSSRNLSHRLRSNSLHFLSRLSISCRFHSFTLFSHNLAPALPQVLLQRSRWVCAQSKRPP